MPSQTNVSLDASGNVIALVDTMEFRRAGLSSLLNRWAQNNDISILALDSAALLAGAGMETRCRMAVLSIGGAQVTSAGVIQDIEQVRAAAPQACLVILSDHKDLKQIVAAFKLGAQGYISSETDPDIALRALSFILCGGTFFPPHALSDLSQVSDAPPEAAAPKLQYSVTVSGSLTLRQREVLSFLRLGKSNKQIARELDMQEATVKVHIRQIMRKLGVANRTQAALQAAHMPGGGAEQQPSTLDAVPVLAIESMQAPPLTPAQTSAGSITITPSYPR